MASNEFTTVSERAIQFDKAAQLRAEEARRAEKVSAFASPNDLAFAINYGAVINAPFSSRDIAAAEFIYGPRPSNGQSD